MIRPPGPPRPAPLRGEPLRRALVREGFARCNGGGAWSEFRGARVVTTGLMAFSGIDTAGAGARGRRPC